jgi:hypothetical protein
MARSPGRGDVRPGSPPGPLGGLPAPFEELLGTISRRSREKAANTGLAEHRWSVDREPLPGPPLECAVSSNPTTRPIFDVLSEWATIGGLRVDQDRERPAHLERVQEFVNMGLADGSLWPIVAIRFPLEEIVEAHRYLESSQQFGEVVVRG